jgi:hypothetical protein
MRGASDIGNNHLYFRKFAFMGSANLFGISETDASEFTNLLDGPDGNPLAPVYSNAQAGFKNDPQQKMWYTVKDGTHHIPLRSTGQGQVTPEYIDQPGIKENAVRGNYAIVAMAMGYDEGNQFFGQTDSQFKTSYTNDDYTGNLKDEGFSIFSIIPYYRYSRR